MRTLEDRFDLSKDIDDFLRRAPASEAYDLLATVSTFLQGLCICRSCNMHPGGTVKISCQFCKVCGQHRNSPEIEA